MTLQQCPRCGSEDCVAFAPRHRFTVPIDICGYHATHWAVCISLREPFMLGTKRRWAWVEFFRWQIAQVFAHQVRLVERIVPIMAHTGSWSDVETSNSASGATTVLKITEQRV